MAQTPANPQEPAVGRPYFPAGYTNPEQRQGPLPWSWARQRLEDAFVYWIGTSAPDGQPHVTPVWGVWLDDRLYFDGSPQTRRSRNLALNPKIEVHLNSTAKGEDVLILHGEAHELIGPERGLAERISQAYTQKYAQDGYSPTPENWDQGGLSVMEPRLAIGWSNFIKDPTRWQF